MKLVERRAYYCIFFVVVGVLTRDLAYIMHCPYQLSKAYEDAYYCI